ncbi:MAG: hypothetical protein DA407_03615 [Bacteroidetes bacterium]|nr:MAG: hypothetical protein DA407_03615 [Bacteroidota bacterium]
MKSLFKIFLLLLLILFQNQSLNAQGPTNEIVELKNEIEGMHIGTSIYYLRDNAYRLTIDDITDKNFENKFTKSEMVRPNFGNEQLAIWNKFTVTNHTSNDWIFELGVHTVDTFTVYYPNKLGGFDKVESGRSVAYQDRNYKASNFLYDIPLIQGDTTTIYFRVSAYIMQYPISVHTKKLYFEKAHKKDISNGAYVGFVILIVLFNFMIWISTRDRNYIFYILYVIMNSLMVFELNGFLGQFIWVGSLKNMWHHGPIIVALSGFFAIIFTINFLETRKNLLSFHRIFHYFFMPLFAIIIILDLIDMKLVASVLNQTIGVLLLITMFTVAVILYKRGFRAARFYIFATSFYFSGAVIYALKTFAIVPHNFITENSIEIGSALEMVLFSLALADKINFHKKGQEIALRDKEILMREQNIVLEKTVKERTKDLLQEKEKSEKLLLNILPEEIADELKETGQAKARDFDMVTILFTDIKNFSGIAEKLTAQELVTEMDTCFKAFDAIVEKYYVEKIKTIGDSYMAAGGVPTPSTDAVKNTVLAAIEMQNFIVQRKNERHENGQIAFEMRIGLHTGNVVAGIVGDRKFQYDIWGDAVNTASRMESSGDVGKVNISQDTYELLKDCVEFSFESRGKIEAKGKGKMEMWFVKRVSENKKALLY